MVGAYFSISSLIFLSIFIFVFSIKRKLNNIDTKIYGLILLITAVGIILDISCFIMYRVGIDINSTLYVIMSKSEFIYYFVWLLTYWHYMYFTIYKKSNNIKKYYDIFNSN